MCSAGCFGDAQVRPRQGQPRVLQARQRLGHALEVGGEGRQCASGGTSDSATSYLEKSCSGRDFTVVRHSPLRLARGCSHSTAMLKWVELIRFRKAQEASLLRAWAT